MNYYVARNGQTYGPYTEDVVRKYLGEGSMQATDMARTDAMPNWTPLGQLLGVVAVPPPPVNIPSAQPFTGGIGAAGNIPPSLHWILIVVIAAFTSGLFFTIWSFIQANWIKTIDPKSRAIRDLAIGIVFPIAGLIVGIILGIIGGVSLSTGSFKLLGASSLAFAVLVFLALGLVGFVFHLKAIFGMRDAMVTHYNTVEPINLRMSPIMTFFFNVLYLQHHMTRIAEWKQTGTLRPQS